MISIKVNKFNVRSTLLVGVVLIAVLILGAILGRSGTAANRVLVKVAYSKKLKTRILVTANGHTLYLWALDAGGKPTCYNDSTYHCSQAWRPLRSSETPLAGRGVKASWLKTVRRTDGVAQITYRGHPLYTDAGSPADGLKPDTKRGDVNGQGFYDWYAVSAMGAPIHKLPQG